MKLLCVIYSIYGGGAEKQMLTLLKNLDRSKFEPVLAVVRRTGREELIVPADVPVHYLDAPRRFSSFFLVLSHRKLIRQLRPDRVLSFLWSINLVTLAAVSGIKPRPRIIVSERTHLGPSIQRFSGARLRRLLVRILYPHADTIAAVSQDTAQNLIDEFNIPAEKIRTIQNGIAVNETRSLMDSPLNNTQVPGPYILSIGNLNATKRHEFTITAFSHIAGQRPGLRLLILGEGDERKRLERMVDRRGLEGRVLLAGYTSNPFPYLARAAAFVSASRFEGFPNAVLEAMACGTPVIAAATPGTREIIDNNRTGLLFPAGNIGALILALNRVLDEPSFGLLLASNALAEVRSLYTVERMTRDFEEALA
jgi:glycosyltransferase involved in cell wall biosynthesis